MQNRVLSGVVALLVPVIISVMVLHPSAALADGREPQISWGSAPSATYGFKPVSKPVYTSKPVYKPVYTSKPVYKPVYTSKPVYKPVYTSKPVYKPSYYTTSSCYSCGGYSSYGYAPSASQAALLSLNFNDNDNDNSNVNNNTNNNIITIGSTSNDDDDDDDNNNNDNDEPICELDVSDTSVDEGDRVTLEWETEDAVYASINNGIGRVDEDGGSERVEIDGDTTFRMTVRDNDGDEDSCSVTVRVDDENNFSNIIIDDEPIQGTYSNVYLSDIPYTGLEAGPYAWANYAAFAGLAAAGGYVIFFMGLPFALRRVGALSAEVETELAEEEGTNPVMQSTMTMPVAVATTSSAAFIAQSDISEFVSALVSADNETASDILENATKNGASASVFLNRASAILRSGALAADTDASVIEMLTSSLETAAKARA